MKKFTVLSRQAAEAFSEKIAKRTLIISITDVGSENAKFANNPNIISILRLKFDDVDYDEPNVMSRFQAAKVVEFVNNFIDCVEEIIVHCEAGVSRSAGVCAALMLIVNGDDTEIFSKARFYPNRVCYRYVLDAFYGGYTNEHLIEEKYRINIAAYRKEEGLDDTDT